MTNAQRSQFDGQIFMVIGAFLLICSMAINHMAIGTKLERMFMFSVEIGVIGLIAALCLVYGFIAWFHAYREELQEDTRLDFGGSKTAKVNARLMEMYSTAAIASTGIAIIALFSGLWCKLGPAGYLAARDAAQLPLLVMSIVLMYSGYMYWKRHAELVRS